jgi:K+-transporting ATPase ATPase B chain
MASKIKDLSLFDPEILGPAVIASFRKLAPQHVAKNPVMFVVEIGSAVTTFVWLRDLIAPAAGAAPAWFTFSVSIWLWFTVVFANFAEAVAEGRGQAQAATLRKMRKETTARRLINGKREEQVPASKLRKGDVVVVEAGEFIPGDGDVIEGIASVDESAITGESAPVIRESGGDRSAVTGGTKVLSDRIVVRITADPGESFLDRMIALVEGAQRQKTPNEIALHILLVGMTIIFLIACATLVPLGLYSSVTLSVTVIIALLVCLIPTTIGGLLSAIGIAGMDRLLRKNVLAMSGRAVEAAGDVDTLLLDKTGTITLGNRMATELIPVTGGSENDLADAAQLASLADETPEGRSRRPRTRRAFHSVQRPHAHERLRPGWPSDPQGRRGRRRRARASARREGAGGARCDRASHLRYRRHAAGCVRRRPSARHHPSQGCGEGRHRGALRALPGHGHPHGDDYR